MSGPAYCDAHLHLADPRLRAHTAEILKAYSEIGLAQAVVVGTAPEDWAQVVEICSRDARLLPAVGLHPWRVTDAPGDWKDQWLHALGQGVRVVGEIGLDQWIDPCDIKAQMAAFRWQLAIARDRNLPTSIHCLKAHEPRLRCLREVGPPARGFKLHAYNGPVATLAELLELGAYFSFNAGQLKPKASRARELIRRVPEDRLLIETDAPDFTPPPELREFSGPGPAAAEPQHPAPNHPANLRRGYAAIAEVRSSAVAGLAEAVAANFERYFLSSAG